MSVLVVGMSHKSAPVPVLERATLSGDALPKLLRDLFHAGDVAGTFVISTCNRVEIYADVNRFHGSVAAVCELLSRYSGIVTHELTGHLYVHYEEGAVKHLLAVAAGLDSMVVGEGQILGQVRSALNVARENGTLGRVLGEVGSAALRTGKRAHSETGIDRTGASLVSVGIDAATEALGIPSLSGRDVLVVGAGSMSAIAATTASRAGAGRVTVANRTRRHAERLAASVGGGTADLADLPRAIAGWIWSSPAQARPGSSSRPTSPRPRCRGAGQHAGKYAGAGAAATPEPQRAARWCSSTWPCPATSTRNWPGGRTSR